MPVLLALPYASSAGPTEDQSDAKIRRSDRLEPVRLKWKQHCFSSGAQSQQEGGAARSRATGKSSDALGCRRLETQRDGRICTAIYASRLIRSPAMHFAGPLDPGTNPLRQSASI